MTLSELRHQLHKWVEIADVKLLKMLYAISKTYLTGKDDLMLNHDDELYRMVYTSARKANCDDDDIQSILEAAQKNNSKLGVTGILVHTNDRFIQVLEGELMNIMMLYRKISKDPRHAGARIRFCEPVKERHFANWHMAYKNMEGDGVGYMSSISDDEKQVYQSFVDGDLSTYKDEGMRTLKTFLLVS